MFKIIKSILLLASVMFLASSCAVHYVGTWQNYDEGKELTDEGNYAIKNDTIGISHAFNTSSGKIQIRMENYSNKPLLINLTKSAMTVNGKAMGFVDGKSTIFGNLNTFGTGEFGAISYLNAEMQTTPNTIIIPPFSFAEGQYTNIRVEKQMVIGEKFDGNWTTYPLFDEPMYMKVLFYNQDDSPLKLTSFINYSLLDKNNQPEVTNTLTQNFYLSSYARLSNISRKTLDQKLISREDMSTYYELKGLGFLGGLLLGAIIVGAIVGEPEE
ncbi:hypothetical protein SAMN06295967_110103 [Belliella buryatensis]|uniref:Lipoprotein n=1 Tax=Belliella buryatensis TaxID=1500549 RepID=A0A239EUT1_9BACT|nr:hypothetical protein [Belliella buryatensis]SNS47652.1 hypothetical protein SAMN06295967_110103 [Belliella buryatensis]